AVIFRETVGVTRLGICMETEAMTVGMASEARIVSIQIQRLRARRSRAARSAASAAPLSSSVMKTRYAIQVSIRTQPVFDLPARSLRIRRICSGRCARGSSCSGDRLAQLARPAAQPRDLPLDRHRTHGELLPRDRRAVIELELEGLEQQPRNDAVGRVFSQ